MLKTLPLVVSAAFLVLGCSSSEEATPLRPVRVISVQSQTLAPEVSYSGEVLARYVTPHSFRVSGKLSARKVDVGSKVKKGQVLAILDLEDLKLNAATQQAARLAAESELARARADYERYVQLREKKLISELDFKRIETVLRVAEAQAEQASAQSRVFENQASYGQLVADANGVVTAIQAEVGQVVAAGQPVITVAREGEREIAIDVPESRVGEIKKSTDIQITLWARPDKIYKGKIREVAPDSDAATRTYTTRITVMNSDADLQLGMTASVVLKGVEQTGIRLPLTVLYQTGEQARVWIVNADNKVESRAVTLGEFHQNEIVVASGLSSGDRVISAGVNRVHEGQTVTILGDAP